MGPRLRGALVPGSGRLTTGSFPPVAPTDLDVPDSCIRLLGL